MANPNRHSHDLRTLILGAIGVVYGDIGTSPLYAFRETFHGSHPLANSEIHVLNVLSLIFWSMMLMVTLKYVILILKADNKGEGGSLALFALVSRMGNMTGAMAIILPVLGIFSAALFYGDIMITPAISVLSAVEGLKIISPRFESFVIPITLAIIAFLFAFQSAGTSVVGKYFGPIMVVWFAVLGVLGVLNIVSRPDVLVAINPYYMVQFFVVDQWLAFLTLGTVVLVLTGAEAIYADMGHFGKKPIRLAWMNFVLPALLLNYFGQGAMVMDRPDAIENPFYLMAPEWFQIPLILLATMATIIASQAVITGAFSVTKQAIQLGYLPRMTVIQTSAREIGQIYLPFVNWSLLFFVGLLVMGFQSSSNLAAAYGVAVTGTMVITTLLFSIMALRVWKWPKFIALPLIVIFSILDLLFFFSNLTKVTHGGWFPLVLGLFVFILLTTWKQGRALVSMHSRQDAMPLDVFFREKCDTTLHVPGTAIFLSTLEDGVPKTLLHNVKHNRVLHDRNIFLHVIVEEKPFVKIENRMEIIPLPQNFTRINLRYGFKENINIPRALEALNGLGFPFNMDETTFFLGRDTIVPTSIPGMAIWREFIFAWLHKNAASAADYYNLPSKRVMELGSRIDI